MSSKKKIVSVEDALRARARARANLRAAINVALLAHLRPEEIAALTSSILGNWLSEQKAK